MEIYFVAFAGMLILKEVPSLYGRMGRNVNTAIGLLAFLVLTWLAALRVDTGTDYNTYAQIWAQTLDVSEATVDDVFFQFLEPLFLATNTLLKTLTDNSVAFFAFYALLTVYPLHRAIVHFRINQAHGYAVYFCVFYLPYAFNGMRQAVAMSLFLFSLKYILTNRPLPVWLIGIVASGFHLTGFLIPLAYYAHRVMERRNWSPRTVLMVGLPCAAAVGQAGLGGRIFFAAFDYKIETYSELFSEGNTIANTVFRIMLASILVFSARLRPDDRTVCQLLNIYLLGLFIYLGLSEFNVLATRFNMFFRVLEVILIPLVIARLQGPKFALIYITTTALLFATLWTVANEPDYQYQSILSVAR